MKAGWKLEKRIMRSTARKCIWHVLVYAIVFFAGAAGGYLSGEGRYLAACNGAAQSLFCQEAEEKEYVMYIGLNDKDTYKQCIPTEEVMKRVQSIFAKYVDGYTMEEAEGAWVDEKGVMTQENTLLCYFHGTKEEEMKKIMDQVIKELNQDAVLLEERDACYTCYYGNGEEETAQEGEQSDENGK